MRIGVNLLPYREACGGLITYIHNLLSELGKISLDSSIEFFLFTRKKILPAFQFSYSNFYYIATPIKIDSIVNRIIFEQTRFAFYLSRYQIGVLFNPTVSGPLWWKGVQVTAVHDCAYDRFADESLSIFHRFYYKTVFPLAIRKAKKIITVSNFSKKEILHFYNPPSEKIKVIYEGPPRIPAIDNLIFYKKKEEFNLSVPYFIFVGNQQPRKNLIRLIKAFYNLKKKTRLPHLLLLTGHKDSKEVIPLVNSLKLDGEIILTGILTRKELAVFLQYADALIFPSLYEGFGLPVLEAQSLGVPVLTSNVTSLPEVAGKGALFVDPYDIKDIARGMRRIATDKELREKLIKEGYKNIKRFSWKRAAKELIEVFKEVYYEKNSPNK